MIRSSGLVPEEAVQAIAYAVARLAEAHNALGALDPLESSPAVGALRRLLAAPCAPRVCALGRRGAGKSSLYNALVGAPSLPVDAVRCCTMAPVWLRIDGPRTAWWWLDTPPQEFNDVANALRLEPPDVALFLCPSTEVDAAIDRDLARLGTLLAGHAGVQLVGVVTRADELARPDGAFAPTMASELREALCRSVAVLRGHLVRVGLAPVAVLPVATEDPLEAWNIAALRARLDALRPGVSALQEARRRELSERLADCAREGTDGVAEALASRARRGLLSPALQAKVEGLLASAMVSLASGRAVSPEAVPAGLLRASSATGTALRALRRVAGPDASAALLAQRVRALGRLYYGLERGDDGPRG